MDATDSSGTGDETDGETETDGGTDTTGPEPDLPGAPLYAQECDIHLQDCPPGEKCLLYKLGYEDGGLEANRQFCSPVVADPRGEAESCSVTGKQENPLGFQDDCESGLFCDGVGNNRCRIFCRKASPSDDAPSCEFPRRCQTSGIIYDGARCTVPCVPLTVEGDEFCTELYGDHVCSLAHLFGAANAEGLDWSPGCDSTPDEAEEAGDACLGVCFDPSLTCAPSGLLGPSCTDDACCTQVCDTNDGNVACTEMGHECIPVFPDHLEEPTYGHLGYCGLPG